MAPLVYLDNNATTQVDPRVVERMLPFLTSEYGNPGSRTHDLGRRAADAVEAARNDLASLIGCSPDDVVFTSGATEANNLAIRGLCQVGAPGHILTAATEHHAVLDVCADLEHQGWQVTYLRVESDGRVDPEVLERELREETRLVSIMWANNETGVINDIAAISAVCRERRVLLHSDAVQAAGKIPVRIGQGGPDLLSLSAHKMYGPKGIGALIASRDVRRRLRPLISGGGQERGLRSGTLPTHQVVGLGEAAKLSGEEFARESAQVRLLRNLLFKRLSEGLDGVTLNGSRRNRLPGTLNVWFEGCDTEALTMRVRDVAFSTGSACTSASLEPSYVIEAMTGSALRASESARFGVGRFTTAEDIEIAADSIINEVRELRGLGRKRASSSQTIYGVS